MAEVADLEPREVEAEILGSHCRGRARRAPAPERASGIEATFEHLGAVEAVGGEEGAVVGGDTQADWPVRIASTREPMSRQSEVERGSALSSSSAAALGDPSEAALRVGVVSIGR